MNANWIALKIPDLFDSTITCDDPRRFLRDLRLVITGQLRALIFRHRVILAEKNTTRVTGVCAVKRLLEENRCDCSATTQLNIEACLFKQLSVRLEVRSTQTSNNIKGIAFKPALLSNLFS